MRRGFTLLEVLLVIIVMGMGLTSLLVALKVANEQNAISSFTTTAQYLAAAKLEEAIDVPTTFANLGNAPGSGGVAQGAAADSDLAQHTVEVTVADLAIGGLDAADCKQITVTVTSTSTLIPNASLETIVTEAAPNG